MCIRLRGAMRHGSPSKPAGFQDLALKHVLMKGDAFSFLRATFYRWMQVWPAVYVELTKAPMVLSVGDLHVVNFGTWRDREDRLIGGIMILTRPIPSPPPTI
jgi:uncharacterized protein (DUF2252 family)